MADLYLTPAEKYTAALGGFYYGDLPDPGTVYTQLIKDILDGSTPDKEPKNILARFIYSLYISDLGDPYPRYELAKLLYWKLHDITPTKSGSILTVTIDGKDDYMTINTDLSRLWYKVLFGSKTDIITEFPYIFNTMQNKLSDWEVFGNTEVSGTPTPDNPVMPQGTGERTGNLFAGEFSQFNNVGGTGNIYTYFYIPEDFTLTLIAKDTHTIPDNTFLGITKDGGQSTGGFTWAIPQRKNVIEGDIFTVKSSTSGYHYVSMYQKTATVLSWILEHYYVMLNTGSAPLPYEPYGIKIPISSAGQTTPIYLGEVQTTRKIKKLVLTGEENVSVTSTGMAIIVLSTPPVVGEECVCSHYIGTNVTIYSAIGAGECTTSIVASGGGNRFAINDVSLSTADAYKAFFAQQYAAGTPVTVWYVLAEPETGIVNEPLMKIGDYADSMSRTQTGIDIPTVIGQNTLDVLTTVKPSSMSIEYTSADENRSRSKRISLLKSPLKKGLIK